MVLIYHHDPKRVTVGFLWPYRGICGIGMVGTAALPGGGRRWHHPRLYWLGVGVGTDIAAAWWWLEMEDAGR